MGAAAWLRSCTFRITRGTSTVVKAGIELLQCCGRVKLIVRGKVIFEPANPSPANLEGFRIFRIPGTQNFRSKRSCAFKLLHVPEIGELERVEKSLFLQAPFAEDVQKSPKLRSGIAAQTFVPQKEKIREVR